MTSLTWRCPSATALQDTKFHRPVEILSLEARTLASRRESLIFPIIRCKRNGGNFHPIQDETLLRLFLQLPGAAASLAIGPFDSHASTCRSHSAAVCRRVLLRHFGADDQGQPPASDQRRVRCVGPLRTLRPSDEVESKHRGRKKRAYRCCSGLISLSRYLRKRPETFFAEKPDPAKAVLVLIPNAAVGCWIIDERDSVRCLAL